MDSGTNIPTTRAYAPPLTSANGPQSINVEVTTAKLKNLQTGNFVTAELWDGISRQQMLDWIKHWQPSLGESLVAKPVKDWPEDWHWNWLANERQALKRPNFRRLCVVCDGKTQGLMHVLLDRTSRFSGQTHQPIAYVDYIQTAPWNRPDIDSNPLYRGVGILLLVAAIELSFSEGFDGRMGLNSLTQAEAFYRKLNMKDFGPDPNYYGLRYFEMTSRDAARLVGR